jgi:signal transduction histidine kinase
MRERADLMGADFQIISRPKAGTRVRLQIPAPDQEVVA